MVRENEYFDQWNCLRDKNGKMVRLIKDAGFGFHDKIFGTSVAKPLMLKLAVVIQIQS